MLRRRWIIAGVVIGVLGLSVAGVAVAAPAVTAVACPQCYGLTSLGDGVYAEVGDDTAGDAYRRMIEAANQRVAGFYGGRTSSPRVLICATTECYHRIGGGAEKGRALRTWALMLSPAGADETIAAHELAHTELRQRLGDAIGQVPYWFNEGLAVLVSGDVRYLRAEGEADRCRMPYDEAVRVVEESRDQATERTYMQAACVVSRWAGARGGPAAVSGLIDDLRAGKSFPDLVRV
ncbi:hypothetical protein [Actinoplanes flavus]|uniref:Peptidase MA superfamily protein n=1 Tax=Actinoplanes flavus TaxID=2820290 RepID=A0ABS3UNI6_9ACTN|nr:hypothetical protein [Actinoplanes flavus]MBO3739278.1 hypothetical protein [Actinoplanes flavus]